MALCNNNERDSKKLRSVLERTDLPSLPVAAPGAKEPADMIAPGSLPLAAAALAAFLHSAGYAEAAIFVTGGPVCGAQSWTELAPCRLERSLRLGSQGQLDLGYSTELAG